MFRPSVVKVNDQSRERVVQVLRESELSTATAFVNAVFEDVKRGGGNFTHDAAILGAAKRQHVPACPKAEQTWNAGFTRKPYLNTSASRSAIRDYLRKNRLPFTASMVDAALQVVDNNLLAPTQEHAAQQEAAKQRRIWINTITGSGKYESYPLWAANHGGFKWLPCSQLDLESDEMLSALAERVPEWRSQLQAGSQRPKPNESATNGGLTAMVPPQKVHYAEPTDEFLAHPDHPESEYTSKELKNLSNTEWRSLLFIHGQSRGKARVNAINRILAGKPYIGEPS